MDGNFADSTKVTALTHDTDAPAQEHTVGTSIDPTLLRHFLEEREEVRAAEELADLRIMLVNRVPRIHKNLEVDRRRFAITVALVLIAPFTQIGAQRMARFLETLCQTGSFCERARIDALMQWIDREADDLLKEIDAVVANLGVSPSS